MTPIDPDPTLSGEKATGPWDALVARLQSEGTHAVTDGYCVTECSHGLAPGVCGLEVVRPGKVQCWCDNPCGWCDDGALGLAECPYCHGTGIANWPASASPSSSSEGREA